MMNKKIVSLALMAMLSLSQTAFASGFAVAEQSVAGLGAAFAGGAAIANDPSTVWYNPAGMTHLCNTQLALGTHWIVPKGKFHNKDSQQFYFAQPGNPGSLNLRTMLGNDGGDCGETAFVQNIYATTQINDCLWVGLGVNSPFGLVTKYDCSWVGRFHAIDSRLLTVNFNPAVGYKINNWLSVGAGVSLQYAHAVLTNAIDVGLLTANVTPCEGYVELTGEDWAWGYNFGVLAEWCGTRLGLHYRSEVQQDLVGKVRYLGIPSNASIFPNSPPLNAILKNAKATSDVEMPRNFSASLYLPFMCDFAFLCDYTWTNWNVVEELKFKFKSLQPDGVVTLKWRNSYRLSTGVEYYLGQCTTLRAGLAFDKTPIPNKQLQTVRIPDANRYWLACGVSQYVSNCIRLDLSYTYIFADSPSIHMNLPEGNPTTDENFSRGYLRGKWDVSAQILSMQAVLEF